MYIIYRIKVERVIDQLAKNACSTFPSDKIVRRDVDKNNRNV